MIEIYKKLPGTNCGKCGEPTCMAFALKVKNTKSKISDCPYVTEADEGLLSQRPITTMDDNYERVSNKLEEEVRNTT